MFGWAVTFLVIAIIAGVFGFAGIAGTASLIAKVLFVVGLVAFLGLLVVGRRPPTSKPTFEGRFRRQFLPRLKRLRADCRIYQTKSPNQNKRLQVGNKGCLLEAT